MTDKEALKVALEALEKCRDGFEFTRQYVGCETLPAIEGWSWYDGNVAAKAAITAIKQALAVQQEPVAYLCENAVGHKYFRWKKPSSTYKPIALYTTPPAAQRPWLDLTDEQIETIEAMALTKNMAIVMTMAALKEKNT